MFVKHLYVHQTCILVVKIPHQEDKIHEKDHVKSIAEIVYLFENSCRHYNMITDLNQNEDVDATEEDELLAINDNDA